MQRGWMMLMIVCLVTGTGVAQNQPAASPSGARSSDGEKSMVKYFSKADLAGKLGRGGTLIEQNNYKVMMAHRTDPGTPEVHRNFTDIFYIVQGETTLVSGGKMTEETKKDPDEPRGKSIEGGETRTLSAGDVLVIPAGTPHWMKEVKGELQYLVVKVKREP